MWYSFVDTSWGLFGFVAQGMRLVATFLPQPRSSMEQVIAHGWRDAKPRQQGLARFRAAVTAYFDGQPTTFDVEVDLAAQPAFHRKVLEACLRIPYASTLTYAQLAQAAGRPQAARAVGNVMARNPLPLVIPCHRVVRSDGSLGGFSGPEGVQLKERLLNLERSVTCACTG